MYLLYLFLIHIVVLIIYNIVKYIFKDIFVIHRDYEYIEFAPFLGLFAMIALIFNMIKEYFKDNKLEIKRKKEKIIDITKLSEDQAIIKKLIDILNKNSYIKRKYKPDRSSLKEELISIREIPYNNVDIHDSVIECCTKALERIENDDVKNIFFSMVNSIWEIYNTDVEISTNLEIEIDKMIKEYMEVIKTIILKIEKEEKIEQAKRKELYEEISIPKINEITNSLNKVKEKYEEKIKNLE